jgi:lipid II:glycine glycyltransferase (peptidoglycan interpeptide bridge formation enzyme)
LFHRVKAEPDASALADALEALRQEYVVRRRFALRIVPCLTRDDGVDWLAQFRARGYRRVESHVEKRTMLVDLDRPLDDLRRGLDQKWRNGLNRAEKGNLEVREGQEPGMFELFSDLYRDMLARKRLSEAGDIASVRAAQAALPDRLQSRVFVALQDGQPSAATVCSAIGRRGVYLAGATGASGMSNKASYLLQWRMIQWLKERECRVYDLHGTNAEANPGVYAFKAGLCGKNGREVEMAGQFEAVLGVRARLVMRGADRANASFKRVKAVLARLRGRDG